jgi:hypothetical protein
MKRERLHIMTNENMVTANLSLEVFGFTGMNKQEILSTLLTSHQCKLVFSTATGEEITLTSFFEPKIQDLSLSDEDGYPIVEADQVTY